MNQHYDNSSLFDWIIAFPFLICGAFTMLIAAIIVAAKRTAKNRRKAIHG